MPFPDDLVTGIEEFSDKRNLISKTKTEDDAFKLILVTCEDILTEYANESSSSSPTKLSGSLLHLSHCSSGNKLKIFNK